MLRPRSLVVVLALALAVLLAGCVPGSEPAPEPEPTPTLLFETEEEALAAAEEAYERYHRVTSDAVNRLDAEAIGTVSTGSAEADIRASISAYQESGQRSSGTIEVAKVDLHGETPDLTRLESLTIIACLDLSEVRVVDSHGNRVSTPHTSELPVISVLTWNLTQKTFVVSSQDGWAGEHDCR